MHTKAENNMEKGNLKVRAVLVKIASRCNLNCTYCYMYNLGDETYKDQPKVMSEDTVEMMMKRVLDHCKAHEIKKFIFILHGGEPLLAGMDFFRMYRQKGREILEAEGIEVEYLLQTNGVLLTKEWCELLDELDIFMGISIDGRKEDNDRFRIDHKGRGSYDRIVAGMQTARKYSKNNFGSLSVLNINADPIATYEHFMELQVSDVDFIFPTATYDQPPLQPDNYGDLNPETPYGDWLAKIFDRWFEEDSKKRFNIRTFQFLIDTILGADVSFEGLGTQSNEELVVETDGSIEASDLLKACGHGFTKAGAHVKTHSLDEALATPLANLYHQSHTTILHKKSNDSSVYEEGCDGDYIHSNLPKKCLGCPIKDICGGGYIVHRYSKKNGFNNPSVYCKDLMKLIAHVQNRVFATIPEEILQEDGASAISYEELKAATEAKLATTEDPEWAQTLESFSIADA